MALAEFYLKRAWNIYFAQTVNTSFNELKYSDIADLPKCIDI